MVCPAYQSAFIYDKDELRKKFSYFKEDSTPKVYAANKTKYLVAEPTTYKQKLRSLKTVEARPVNPVVPDSLIMDGDVSEADLNRAAQSVIDSTYIVPTVPEDSAATAEDSVYVISKDREVRVLKYNFPDSLKFDAVSGRYLPEKPSYYVSEVGFNTEQNNYMWYLRDVLVLPDVRLAQADKEKQAAASAKSKKKKGIKGFFAGLFGKKKKASTDSTDLQQQAVSEEDQYNVDFNDLDNPAPDSAQNVEAPASQSTPSKEKKGILSKLKSKKEKKPKTTTPAPAEKKEEEGDGF
jgi:hypothetical protein